MRSVMNDWEPLHEQYVRLYGLTKAVILMRSRLNYLLRQPVHKEPEVCEKLKDGIRIIQGRIDGKSPE